MSKSRPLFVLLMLCGAGYCMHAQEILTPDQLRSDLADLRGGLEKNHPGLYWYTSAAEFDSAWKNLDAMLNQPLSDIEFFKLLLPIVARVKCSHTLFYPSQKMMKNGARFPLDVFYSNNRLFLFTRPGDAIPSGSELLSINKRAVSEVLERISGGLQSQGGNPNWKKVILENDFQNYYYYMIERPQEFEIQFVNRHTGATEILKLMGSQDSRRKGFWKDWYHEGDGPPLEMKFLDQHGIAIVTIRSFNEGRAKHFRQNFDQCAEAFFSEILKKGYSKLIIDMRGNEGGNGPEKLYAHIALDNDRTTDGDGKKIGQ